jgi:hypothetical protein
MARGSRRRRSLVAVAGLIALTLTSPAAAQEQKPPIAFADTSTISLVCPAQGKKTMMVEIQNETAQPQTIELRLSPLRNEDGVVFAATDVCGGVEITPSLTVEDGGLSGVAAISAGMTPSGGAAVYSGTVAAFVAGGPVVRRPLEIREAAVGATAKPLVTTVSATVYRGRPWGDEHIDIPVNVAPNETLALADEDVVGALAGGGDSGTVTYAGKHKLTDKTTDVELAVDGLGPDDYEGDVDLVPGVDEGKVTLKLTVKDWWPFAAFFVLAGIITGLAVQRWLNVSLPKSRLLDRVDRAMTRQGEAAARLKETADAAGNKPWGSFALNDVSARQSALRRQIRDETKLYYLGIDAKLIEALEAKIKPLEDDIDQLDAVHDKMATLENALDALKSYPVADLALGDDDKKVEPVLSKKGRDLLNGASLSSAQLKQRLADAEATGKAARDMAGLLDWAAQLYAALRELNEHGSADLKKELKPIFDNLQSTTYALWQAPNAKQFTALDAGADLVKIHKAIADAVAKHNVPDERGGASVTVAPVPVEYALEMSQGGYAITLGKRATDGGYTGGAVGADDVDEVAVDAAEVKAARRRGYGVAAIAFAVALVTALTTLYIGKPFGTFWDYVSALTWGLATQAVLTTLATAIGGVAGLRALGIRIRGA